MNTNKIWFENIPEYDYHSACEKTAKKSNIFSPDYSNTKLFAQLRGFGGWGIEL